MENCQGYCKKCDQVHSLSEGNSRSYALDLFETLEIEQRIDFDTSREHADRIFSNECLYGEFRGQMFGVLECENRRGETVILKAYSCQHNGVWNCDGWVPPLLNVDEFNDLMMPGEKRIKSFNKKIGKLEDIDSQKKYLMKQRKEFSQELMKDLFNLYVFINFAGETVSIHDAFYLDKGIPTGTGDCCAPKLLNFAIQNDLKPLGISEFFFGKENNSKTRKHGEFYGSCMIRCEPILGFLLCGLDMYDSI